MKAWLKTLWSAGGAVILTLGAIFAAASAVRRKEASRQWQQRAEDIEQGNVDASLETAEAASTQAKLHAARAEEARRKAEERITRIGGQNEEIADILDRWSRPT